MAEDQIPPMDHATSRQVYIGWAGVLISAALAYFFGGALWAYLCLFFGLVLALRGHLPHLFFIRRERQILANEPAKETESPAKWGVALVLALISAGGATMLHHHFVPAPNPTATPHLQANLVIDETPKNVDLKFHIVVENIGDVMIDEIRSGQSTTIGAEIELHPLIPRALPPKGKISIPGITPNHLMGSHILYATFVFKALGHDPGYVTASVAYSIPTENLKPDQMILPSSARELLGDYTPTSDQANQKLNDKFAQAEGGITMHLFEHNPDGSPNRIHFENSEREFSFDGGARRVFLRTPKNGKILSFDLSPDMDLPHFVLITWGGKESPVLVVDGKQIQ